MKSLQGEAEGGELGAGVVGAGVQDALDAELAGVFHEERAVIEIGHLFRTHLGDIKGEAVDVEVRFAQVDEGGDDEEVDKFPQMEAFDAVDGDFPAFVADNSDAEFEGAFEFSDVFDGFREWTGLFENELLEFVEAEVALFVENGLVEVFLERHFSRLIRVVDEMVTAGHFLEIDPEMFGGFFAEGGVPSIGEEDASDVEEESGDGESGHVAGGNQT